VVLLIPVKLTEETAVQAEEHACQLLEHTLVERQLNLLQILELRTMQEIMVVLQHIHQLVNGEAVEEVVRPQLGKIHKIQKAEMVVLEKLGLMELLMLAVAVALLLILPMWLEQVEQAEAEMDLLTMTLHHQAQ
jgi:hypothetical protein